ncbi:hypothetical protein BDZ45DRAFT_375772 [Acephala macrosclerotiorum]|nr:hypothetical protein BDZ45DRAFT_375772 [Acephala macrosclerotiorum]
MVVEELFYGRCRSLGEDLVQGGVAHSVPVQYHFNSLLIFHPFFRSLGSMFSKIACRSKTVSCLTVRWSCLCRLSNHGRVSNELSCFAEILLSYSGCLAYTISPRLMDDVIILLGSDNLPSFLHGCVSPISRSNGEADLTVSITSEISSEEFDCDHVISIRDGQRHFLSRLEVVQPRKRLCRV